MTEYARQRAAARQPTTPEPKPKARVTRQRRARLNRDAEYLVLHDIYLEENPECVRCGKPATQIHHIVGGTAGRARSLLNSDTWLGVCSTVCHDKVDSLKLETQLKLKQINVKKTIERLLK